MTATTAEPRMERRRSIGIAPPAATRDPWSLALRSSPMRGVGASMYDTVSEVRLIDAEQRGTRVRVVVLVCPVCAR